MSPPLTRIDIYTNLEGFTPTWKAAVPALSCITTEKLEGKAVVPRLVLKVPTAWESISEVVIGRVVRLTFSDGTTTTFDEYRISRVEDSSGLDGVTTIIGAGPILDLARVDTLMTATVGTAATLSYRVRDTGSNLITNQIIPMASGATTIFVAGTVTSSASVDLVLEGDTPLSALIKLLRLLEDADGATYWLSVSHSPGGSYAIHIQAPTGFGYTPYLRTGKNLRSLRRTRDASRMATRLYVLDGTENAIGDNQWEVTAVSVNTYIDIEGIDGGYSPVLRADALNGYYVVDDAGGTHQITDSAYPGRLYMSSTSGISVGEWVSIRADSSKTELPYLEDTTAQATYGVLINKLPAIASRYTNYFLNPDLADWSGALPTSWTSPAYSDPVKVTTAGYWLTGGCSAHLDGTGGTTRDFQCQRSVYMTAGQTCTVTAWVRLDSFASSSAVGYITFTNPQTSATENVALDGTVSGLDTLGVWLSVSRTYNITSSGTKTVTLYFYSQSSSNCDLYVDAAMVSFASEEVAFQKSSGPAINWQTAISTLITSASPITSYDVDLVDLYRVDPVTWSQDDFNVGDGVYITEPDLGIDTTGNAATLVALTTDHLTPANTKVTLSTRQEELTALLAEAA